MLKQKTNKVAKKKGGTRLRRTEIVQVRLDPRLRFSAELASKAQKRTLSSFIEWSIENNVYKVEINHLVNTTDFSDTKENPTITVQSLVNKIWDYDEVIRFVRLAQTAPLLLSTDEEIIWSVINKHDFFWINSIETNQREPFIDLIRAMWIDFQLLSSEVDFDGDYIAMATDKMLLLNTSASPEKIAALKKAMNDLWPSHADE